MAILKLYREKLQHNYRFLVTLFLEREIEWGVVSKLLCGHKTFLKELVELGVVEFHDTRISNLKMIKNLAPNAQTVYIKPPAKRNIANIIKYADVSFDTDYSTLQLLSDEAVKQGKQHKVIIMIEMGDLREGVMGEDLVEFYAQVFNLPNIQIVGIGTNLNCLNGVMPSHDKLIQLSLYKQLIEARFNRKIPWITGGTTVTVPLILRGLLPKAINHFRVGEGLFFGKDLFNGGSIEGMETEVFTLHAEIIELYEKPVVPIGDQMENVFGNIPQFDEKDIGRMSFRAILDMGLLDINPSYLTPHDEAVTILEASSDMLVVDLGEEAGMYKVGVEISFSVRYMGVLSLMNSRYIDKVVV